MSAITLMRIGEQAPAISEAQRNCASRPSRCSRSASSKASFIGAAARALHLCAFQARRLGRT